MGSGRAACSRSSVEELETKLETEISFDLSKLWAHDLQGRAAAFQKMIAGGMALDAAVAASGLMIGDGAAA